MNIKKSLAGAGIGILALAGYLGFASDDLSPQEIVQIEQQAQELFGGNANNVKQRIFNEMKPAQVKAKGKDWELTGMHFKSTLKENAEDGWEYEENGKKLGFESTGMAWDGKKVKTKAAKVKGEIKELEVKYEDALGAGIDIKIVQDNYHFQKIIEIESLASLGEIPAGAEFLEFSFKLSGDFDLPAGRISDRIPFGENSFVNPIRAWDSSTPTIEEENPNLMSGVFGEIEGKILTKKIPVAWLLTAEFPIKTDATITYGSEAVFEEATTSDISLAMLDATHIVVAYIDVDNTNKGTAIVGSISGTTISWGSPNIFNNAVTSLTSVAALDSTHFVVAYTDNGNSYNGTAIVGVTDGSTTISSYGSENVYNATTTEQNAVTALDSTHFAVAYSDEGGDAYGIARVGVVSGTTISSYGAENIFNSASTSIYTGDMGIATLDSTHFVIAYNNANTTGDAIVGVTDGGTTISSYGSASSFNAGASYYMGVDVLDSTHFVVAYKDQTTGSGTAIVGEVSGTTISSYGSKVVYNTGGTEWNYPAALDSTTFVVAYKDDVGSDYGGARATTISGTAINAFGDENLFNSAVTQSISVVGLSETHFAIAYQDAGNSDYGTGIVGEITAAAGNTGAFFQFFD